MGEKKIQTLIDVPTAIKKINESWNLKGSDGENLIQIFEPKTIYNNISAKKLKRYGPRHHVLLDEEEVLARFGPK